MPIHTQTGQCRGARKLVEKLLCGLSPSANPDRESRPRNGCPIVCFSIGVLPAGTVCHPRLPIKGVPDRAVARARTASATGRDVAAQNQALVIDYSGTRKRHSSGVIGAVFYLRGPTHPHGPCGGRSDGKQRDIRTSAGSLLRQAHRRRFAILKDAVRDRVETRSPSDSFSRWRPRCPARTGTGRPDARRCSCRRSHLRPRRPRALDARRRRSSSRSESAAPRCAP